MPRLLLEIGCEELPAWACYEAEAQLPDLCREHVGAAPAELYVAPRRLGFLVADVPERTPDEWVKGPPETLRERAAAGFARRYGAAPEDLEVRDGHLGLTIPGRPVREVLPERLDAVVRGLQFTRTMRWDDSGLRFPRPIRWVLAKLDAETVVGAHSYGHRFTTGAVEVTDAASYADALRAARVEPVAAERLRRIRDGLDALGEWSDPAGVLREVVHLVEDPTVVEDEFDERYLELPERVIQAPMQKDQRYFPLGGNRFAVAIDGGDPDVALPGHRSVLENRLEDARFTFERDLARGIEALAADLARITFFEGAGTYADKTDRLVALVDELGGDAAAREAAPLAKADQAAELVFEFPDLEGYVGAVYARRAGFSDDVAQAIEEQYLPDAAGGPLPASPGGRVLAAADKLDNLDVAFARGQRPTGSRDPLALRRAAIGLCRLAVEAGLHVPRRLLRHGSCDFVEERLEGLLDVPVEYVRAARAAPVEGIGDVARLARALHDAAETPEFDAVYTAYDRAHRLAGRAAADAATDLDQALLEEETERLLAERLAATSLEGLEPGEALRRGAQLAPLVERLFEDVLIMAPDARLRANRLRLLLDLRDTLGVLGDLSQIPR